MDYKISKTPRSKTQILKLVQSIPADLYSDDYYQLYINLFKKIHPSSRRIYFHEIFCEKLTLLCSHDLIIIRLIQFYKNYLVNLKKNKENYKILKKSKKQLIENHSNNLMKSDKRKLYDENKTLNSNTISLTKEKVKQKFQKIQKCNKKILIKKNKNIKSNIELITQEQVQQQYNKYLKRINKKVSKIEPRSIAKILYTGMTN